MYVSNAKPPFFMVEVSRVMQSAVDLGKTFATIKNTKVDLPNLGFLSEIWTKSYKDGEFRYELIGHLVYQRGRTRREQYSGDNLWEVFGVKQTPEQSKIAKVRIFWDNISSKVLQAHHEADWLESGIRLGRTCGEDCIMVALTTAEPQVTLPNGRILPESFRGECLMLAPSYPSSQQEAEELWEYIPFNDGGYPGCPRNECPKDLYERELVSYGAIQHPQLYRMMLAKGLTVAEMAPEMAKSIQKANTETNRSAEASPENSTPDLGSLLRHALASV